MGKTGGSSWFTAVKNVFRSPEKKCPRRRDRRQGNDNLAEDDEDEQQQQTVLASHLIIFSFLGFKSN